MKEIRELAEAYLAHKAGSGGDCVWGCDGCERMEALIARRPEFQEWADVLARFALAVLDALDDERAYAQQIFEINRGHANALEWAGRVTAADAIRSAIARNMERK